MSYKDWACFDTREDYLAYNACDIEPDYDEEDEIVMNASPETGNRTARNGQGE